MSKCLLLFVFGFLGLIVFQAPARASLSYCPETMEALVMRTQNIVVADVVSLEIKGGVLEYEIKVIENIKGNAPSTLVVRFPVGTPWSNAERKRRFLAPYRAADVRALHSGRDFWLDWLHTAGEGMLHPSTCEAVFELRRGRHLIFLTEPYHAKAFEPIADSNDQWLRTVKSVVADRSVIGRVVDPISFMKMFHSVYFAQCFRPGLERRKPRLLYGGEVGRDTYPITRIDNANPCQKQAENDVFFVLLFADQNDYTPIGVPVEDGVLRFAERYGDLVLENRQVSLGAALLSLQAK